MIISQCCFLINNKKCWFGFVTCATEIKNKGHASNETRMLDTLGVFEKKDEYPILLD